jgi:hypothetical protein
LWVLAWINIQLGKYSIAQIHAYEARSWEIFLEIYIERHRHSGYRPCDGANLAIMGKASPYAPLLSASLSHGDKPVIGP